MRSVAAAHPLCWLARYLKSLVFFLSMPHIPKVKSPGLVIVITDFGFKFSVACFILLYKFPCFYYDHAGFHNSILDGGTLTAT